MSENMQITFKNVFEKLVSTGVQFLLNGKVPYGFILLKTTLLPRPNPHTFAQ